MTYIEFLSLSNYLKAGQLYLYARHLCLEIFQTFAPFPFFPFGCLVHRPDEISSTEFSFAMWQRLDAICYRPARQQSHSVGLSTVDFCISLVYVCEAPVVVHVRVIIAARSRTSAVGLL